MGRVERGEDGGDEDYEDGVDEDAGGYGDGFAVGCGEVVPLFLILSSSSTSNRSCR